MHCSILPPTLLKDLPKLTKFPRTCRIQVIEPDTYRRTGDDEDHPHPLMKPVPRAEGPGLAGYTREEEIGRSVWVGSGNGGEVEDEEAWVVRGLKGRRSVGVSLIDLGEGWEGREW